MSKNYILITTLSHFKHRYAIPVEDFIAEGFEQPVDVERLQKRIAAGEFKEFSQLHLGEVVSAVSEYTETDTLTLFDIENAYLKDWPLEKKLSYLDNWKDLVY